MESSPFFGVLMYMAGGLFGASFYLPLKGVRKWSWESFWLVYCVTALVIVPWALAVNFSPNVFTVLKSAEGKTLLYSFLFGAMWGMGGLTWGLGIRYLGVGLGLAIACGTCAAVGTLVPPLFPDFFIDQPAPGASAGQAAARGFAELLKTSSGITILIGVSICLVGIVVTGAAGMSKEREMSEEQKKSSVKDFDFKKGLLLAVFSGIMSAGMSFGLREGDAIKALAQTTAPVTPEFWLGLPVLVVVLLGGFTVNILWCLFLNLKNRSGGDYVRGGAMLPVNYVLSILAGAIWYSQMLLYTMGDTHIGHYKFSGWSLFMSGQIIFSSLWGIALLEWRGSSGRTKKLLAAGLGLLVLSLVVIGYGNYLKKAA